jgi:predicted SprT family Zn-dependent metalloprotease
MSGVFFKEATEVREIAEELIDKYHPHLKDAKDVIGYYFREGSSDWAGKAKKCTAFERYVTGKMLFVFINAEAWNAMKHEQRVALVDHELCHFSRKSFKDIDPETKEWITIYEDKNESDSWSIREHDVEEFSDVIKRHGLWDTGIEKFAAAVREADYQMSLDDIEREEKRMLRAVK